MNELLTLSENIAREAHAGQMYDVRDYVDAHVAPVAGLIAMMGYGEDYQMVGWLHDVPEDSNISVEELKKRGIPNPVADAVELLRKKGESHEVYLGQIATNSLAIVGKYADSSINLANTILNATEIDPLKRKRWFNTYSGNTAFLFPLLPTIE